MIKVKTIVLAILVSLLLGCVSGSKGEGAATPSVAKDSICDTVNIWEEYRCFRPTNPTKQGSAPYPNCFLIIKDKQYFYFRDGELVEQDSLSLSPKYKFTVFVGKNSPDDIIQYLNENGDSIALFRYNFDGEREYFKKNNSDSLRLMFQNIISSNEKASNSLFEKELMYLSDNYDYDSIVIKCKSPGLYFTEFHISKLVSFMIRYDGFGEYIDWGRRIDIQPIKCYLANNVAKFYISKENKVCNRILPRNYEACEYPTWDITVYTKNGILEDKIDPFPYGYTLEFSEEFQRFTDFMDDVISLTKHRFGG